MRGSTSVRAWVAVRVPGPQARAFGKLLLEQDAGPEALRELQTKRLQKIAAALKPGQEIVDFQVTTSS